MSSNQGESEKDATVRQTILANLEAPRLQGVATKHFTAFQKRRDLYEKQLAEKNREPGVNVTPTSFKASIDDTLLDIFITAGWIDAASVEEITEEQLQNCVRERANFEPEGDDLSRIRYLIRKVKMDDSIKDPEQRVWTLHYKYVTTLHSHGLRDLPKTKPHIAIKHILKVIKPKRLRERMQDIVEWKKDEHFEKKDFGAFMRELARQAKKLEEKRGPDRISESEDESEHDDSSRSTEKESRKFERSKNSKDKRSGKKRGRNDQGGRDSKGGSSKKRKRDLPLCLNPDCGEHHYVKNCKNTSEEQKTKLLKEFKAQKKRDAKNKDNDSGSTKGRVNRIAADRIDSHSSLFSGFFCDGAVEVVVMADQGSDVNLIPREIFDQILLAKPALQLQKLDPPHLYNGIAKNGEPITCTDEISLDIQLRIRHGTRLALRSMLWKVGEAAIDQVIIGREVLQSIGCDNRAILAAACDKNDGVINIPTAMAEDAKKRNAAEAGAICTVMREGLYHSSAMEGDDGLEDSKVYIDLGDDEPGVLDEALQKLIAEAEANGMSETGVEELTEMIQEFKPVFG